jgi:hypothetical protein
MTPPVRIAGDLATVTFDRYDSPRWRMKAALDPWKAHYRCPEGMYPSGVSVAGGVGEGPGVMVGGNVGVGVEVRVGVGGGAIVGVSVGAGAMVGIWTGGACPSCVVARSHVLDASANADPPRSARTIRAIWQPTVLRNTTLRASGSLDGSRGGAFLEGVGPVIPQAKYVTTALAHRSAADRTVRIRENGTITIKRITVAMSARNPARMVIWAKVIPCQARRPSHDRSDLANRLRSVGVSPDQLQVAAAAMTSEVFTRGRPRESVVDRRKSSAIQARIRHSATPVAAAAALTETYSSGSGDPRGLAASIGRTHYHSATSTRLLHGDGS